MTERRYHPASVEKGWASFDADEAKRFRVNFGNGQASHDLSSVRACVAYMAECCSDSLDAFIQFRDNGEWFTYRGKR